MKDIEISFTGQVAGEVEDVRSPAGFRIVRISLAHTPSYFSEESEEGIIYADTNHIDVIAYRSLADAISEIGVEHGDYLNVRGILRLRKTYHEDGSISGQKQEVLAEDLGFSMLHQPIAEQIKQRIESGFEIKDELNERLKRADERAEKERELERERELDAAVSEESRRLLDL